MKFCLPVLAALAAVLVSDLARADAFNRNLFPIGERESVLANTGITSPTAGAVFYNPANLARIDHSEISMSGTTLLRFSVDADAFAVVEGVNQPFKASGLLTIPASLASTYDLGEFALATAILVPDAFEIDNITTFEGNQTRVTVMNKQRRQDLWLGASLARRFGDVSVGLSAFGVQTTASAVVMLNQVDETMPDLVNQLILNSRTSVLGATAVAGAHWQVTPLIGVGARVQSPLLEFKESSELYFSRIDSTAMPVQTEDTFEEDEVLSVLPWDVGVGISIRPTPTLEIVADANMQLPGKYTTLVGEDVDDTTDTTVRASAGVEWAINQTFALQGGFLYNPSAAPPTSDEQAHEDYAGGTLGISRRSGRTRTGIGAFFMQSWGTAVPADLDGSGDPSDRRRVSSRLIGGLITVTYQL